MWLYLFIEVELIYKVMLISAVQQSDSIVSIYSCQYIKICLFVFNLFHILQCGYLVICYLSSSGPLRPFTFFAGINSVSKDILCVASLCGCPSSGEWWLGAELIDPSSCPTPAPITAQPHCPRAVAHRELSMAGLLCLPEDTQDSRTSMSDVSPVNRLMFSPKQCGLRIVLPNLPLFSPFRDVRSWS